nr:hypothetical protein [uncultured Methanospirillum sp.]
MSIPDGPGRQMHCSLNRNRKIQTTGPEGICSYRCQYAADWVGFNTPVREDPDEFIYSVSSPFFRKIEESFPCCIAGEKGESIVSDQYTLGECIIAEKENIILL